MPGQKRFLFVVIFVVISCLFAQAQTANAQQYKYVFTVAKDGSGDYKFIQDAIDAMRVFPLAPITLYIKNSVHIPSRWMMCGAFISAYGRQTQVQFP